MSEMTGRCSCGDLAYKVSGKARSVVNCHCRVCRKMNGSAFSTYVAVGADDFQFVDGVPASYQVSENIGKSYCGSCGTPIFNSNIKYEGLFILHLGSLDVPEIHTPQANIYCDSELDWIPSISDQKQYQQGFT